MFTQPRWVFWLTLALVGFGMVFPSQVVVAGNRSLSFVALYRQDVPVQLDISSSSDISTLDPQLAEDPVSIEPIENLFLGLTDFDPITQAVRPELATDWEVSADGLEWTFHLRNDVMWMRYDPATGEAEAIRPVVADDFVYGIKRACDSRVGSYYGSVTATLIDGCELVNNTLTQETTDELVYGDTVKVSAPDEQTLVIGLQYPAGFFLSITTMWMLRPTPREVIETHGSAWTAPGTIVTNGPYLLEENTAGTQRVFVRNTALPADLAGIGNIERVVIKVIEGTEFDLYWDNQLDRSSVPSSGTGLPPQLGPERGDQIKFIVDNTVFYFAFAFDKAPFDNVHVRRAFSAIIEREFSIQWIRQGRGLAMIHFTPPSMAGAPPINEVGVGYDPEYAREQLALAGYPNCEGFPNVDMVAYSSAETWLDFWVASAEQELGCDPEGFEIQQLEFLDLLEATRADTPTEERPNAWTFGWGPDYPDAHNWLHDVLSCHVDNRFMRPCNAIDDLIDQAARESDPAIRAELYRQIEEDFFGPDGEFPIAPIFMSFSYSLTKSWYTGPFETDSVFGGAHWDAYSIDMATKLAVRATE